MTSIDSIEATILQYLRGQLATGERYFRSKRIAKALGLTPNQVGVRMPRLAEGADDLEITAWGRSRSTTWLVEPR